MPMAVPRQRTANRSLTYTIMTEVRPGINRPCRARKATSRPNVGASPHSSVGTTSSALAPTMTGLRPMRSESGPAISDPAATASTTADTVSPAVAGGRSNARPSTGRMACVVYMSAKTPAVPRKRAIQAEGGIPPKGDRARLICPRRCTMCHDAPQTPSFVEHISVARTAAGHHDPFGLLDRRAVQGGQRRAGGDLRPVPLAVVPVAHAIPQQVPRGAGFGAGVVVAPPIKEPDEVTCGLDVVDEPGLVQAGESRQCAFAQSGQAEVGHGVACHGHQVGVLEDGAKLVRVDHRYRIGVLVDAVQHVAADQVQIVHTTPSINSRDMGCATRGAASPRRSARSGMA